MEKNVFGVDRPTAKKISENLNKAGMSYKQATKDLERLSDAWSGFGIVSTLAPYRQVDK